MTSPTNPMDLSGRVALVTGAARGIGRVTARRLAALGATVALADILPEVEDTARALRNEGHRAVAARFDVANAEDVRAGVDTLRSTAGSADVLVSNAAIVANIAPVARMTPAAWERELAINLTGAFNLIQAVLGPMIENGWGRIIVISSGAAQSGLHNQAAYAASKAGLLGLVKTVALEHARHGISCNAILPGMIETENVRAMPAEIQEAAIQQAPARRLGRMEEVAHLAAFLASEEAGFLNGAEINIDGGLRLAGLALGSRKELAQRGKA